MSGPADYLLTDLLRAVSRSFYLTMRVLPAKIRPQISLAYLLARTTDTIADTDIVAVAERLGALEKMRECIVEGKQASVDFGALAVKQESSSERILLERFSDSIAILQSFSESDQALIRDVLKTIISGQDLDLRRFGGGSETNIRSLQHDDELDDYTFRVAGCVGEFWTKMCLAHLFDKAATPDDIFLNNGIRFGKGLQLVNILRDLPKDLHQGRCYLPNCELEKIGLIPADLLKMETWLRLQPLYEKYLRRAREHLIAGWQYTTALPKNQIRVRLACAWPILIGADTVQKLHRANVLDANQRVKTSRREVRRILVSSILLLPFHSSWEKQFS